ncbi:hypothetical protein [Phycicoccus avicenniae]|uniref:hypothetical protein n=1 Tax=Phycicoccus avicenniae TaxID=2828860 RepID=UPI003D2A255F
MTTLHAPHPPGTRRGRGWSGNGLLGVLVLVALNAVYGAVGLMVDGMGMPKEWLEHLPVDSWLLPGVALLLSVAVPQALAAVAAWRGGGNAPRAGLLAGVALVLWIVVQVLVLQRYFFLQPVIAGLGLLEVALAVAWSRRRAGLRAGRG